MVESRVVVPEAADAQGSLRRLTVVFDESSLSFDGAWLEAGGASSAKVWPRNRSFTVVEPVPIATVS
jgi:hypothetical protein